MRETSKRTWQSWRVTLAQSPVPVAPRFARPVQVLPEPPAAALPPEVPGPDGIRHDLVARVRAEIEAGTYDTDERWQLAEERLFARLEARR